MHETSRISRFRLRLRRPSAFETLGIVAFLFGLLMLYGGLGHTIAIVGSMIKHSKPYDFRFAGLLTTGIILTFGALTSVIASWSIARGSRRAAAWSAGATGGIVVYCAILLPVEAARDAAGPAFVLSLAYLVTLLGVMRFASRRQ